MPSLVEKFDELERLLRHYRGTLALHTGVPFVLLIYDPEAERRCREEQVHLQNKLEDQGIRVCEISVEGFIFQHYTKLGLLDLIFEQELTQPQVVARDLARHYRPALVAHIIAEAEALEGEDGVLFLTRVAHLYPFVRVANLLEDLENRVTLPLVVFYPGEELDNELRFLKLENSDGPHTKYRARRI